MEAETVHGKQIPVFRTSTARASGRGPFLFSKNPLRKLGQRIFAIHLGPGAGFIFRLNDKLRNGWTFSVAINCRQRNPNTHPMLHNFKFIQFVLTDNWNKLPYVNWD